MLITKEKFESIISHYRLTLVIDSDIEHAFDFVEEVIREERRAAEESGDYPSREIDRLAEAERVVRNLCYDYCSEIYDDLN